MHRYPLLGIGEAVPMVAVIGHHKRLLRGLHLSILAHEVPIIGDLSAWRNIVRRKVQRDLQAQIGGWNGYVSIKTCRDSLPNKTVIERSVKRLKAVCPERKVYHVWKLGFGALRVHYQ